MAKLPSFEKMVPMERDHFFLEKSELFRSSGYYISVRAIPY